MRGAGVIEPRGGPIEFWHRPPRRRLSAISRLPPDPSGKSCQTRCEAEEGCRAWTYVRPGYGGPAATCYLKGHIARPQQGRRCGRVMRSLR